MTYYDNEFLSLLINKAVKMSDKEKPEEAITHWYYCFRHENWLIYTTSIVFKFYDRKLEDEIKWNIFSAYSFLKEYLGNDMKILQTKEGKDYFKNKDYCEIEVSFGKNYLPACMLARATVISEAEL